MSESVLELLPVGLVLVTGGEILGVNSRFVQLARHEGEALVGLPLDQLFAPDDIAPWLEGDRSEEHPPDAPWRVGGRSADGSPFVVGLRGVPKTDEWVLVAEPWGPDIVPAGSPLPPPEYFRRDQWTMDDIDRVISHDLRGALRGTNSFLTLLGRQAADVLGEKEMEFLETAQSAAQRADYMAQRVVDWLRLWIRPVTVDAVDPADLIDRAQALSQSDFGGESADIEIGSHSKVWGDRNLIAPLLAELITNARKFSEGSVRVHIDMATGDDGWSTIMFTDDGPGVDAEFVEDAFSPFRLLQAKGRYPGIGMGLPICRRIAEIQGGACRILPTEERGTTVQVRLSSFARS